MKFVFLVDPTEARVREIMARLEQQRRRKADRDAHGEHRQDEAGERQCSIR